MPGDIDLKTVKIKNPKTGKQIRLTSALTYGSTYGLDDPAYKAARAYLKKHLADKKSATASKGPTRKEKLTHTVTNPLNGKQVKVASALAYKAKYGVDNPVYQAAIQYLDGKIQEMLPKEILPATPPRDIFEHHTHFDGYMKTTYGEEYKALRAKYMKEAPSLEWYADFGYKPINKCLRQLECNEDTDGAIDRIKKIFDDAPPLKEPLTVLRSIGRSPEDTQGVAVKALIDQLTNSMGGTFNEKAFCSTTATESGSDTFIDDNGIEFKITLPKGTKVLGVNIFSGFVSQFSTESELLLPPNATFKIIGKTVHEKLRKRALNVTVFELEYILEK